MRRWLPALAFDRPVTVLVMFVALLVLGGIAWFRVPVQLMPDGLEARQLFVRDAHEESGGGRAGPALEVPARAGAPALDAE